MVKGKIEKEKIFAVMLKVFPNSYKADEKTLRIPIKTADGEMIEVKVGLTVAKEAAKQESAMPMPVVTDFTEPTVDELEELRRYLNGLSV